MTKRRYQLIELEDQDWFPKSIRDAGTDYLQFVFEIARPYTTIAAKLAPALTATSARHIVDLCAGGGGPWRGLLPVLQTTIPDLRVHLTDKYPNLAAWQTLAQEQPDAIQATTTLVDATAVPASLPGFRTLFSAFHHFPPDMARAILADAVRQRQGIAVFEFAQRRLPTLLTILTAPTVAYLVMPLMRPFRWSRLFWTYVIPAALYLILWDGIVSCLRMYTPDELRAMTVGLADDYVWEVGEASVQGSPIPMTYLIGYPAN